MNEKITSLLLHVIKTDGDLKKLRHYGYSYRQIGELIENNINNGNLLETEEVVTLSEQGILFLKENQNLIKETDKSKWIDLDLKNKIPKIDKEEVFLPSRGRFSFQKKLL